MDEIGDIVGEMSNIDNEANDCDNSDEFLVHATQQAMLRRTSGYNADGSCGGVYSEHSPPPGKAFGGYLKGCTGIVWDDIAAPPAIMVNDTANTTTLGKAVDQDVIADNEPMETEEKGPGYCPHCGYSLFHYAGIVCPGTGSNGARHPSWKCSPPPSFSDVNC